MTARPQRSRSSPAPAGLRPGLIVVADGSGPLVEGVSTALRSCGIGKVIAGPYAAEALGFFAVPRRRRGEQVVRRVDRFPVHAVIAVTNGVLDPQIAAPWHRAGIVHLPLEVHPDLVQVGPLVIPGVSACLACRSGTSSSTGSVVAAALDPLDPPYLLDPLDPPIPTDPGVVVLAAAVAALTIRQVLVGDHSLAGVSCDVVGARPEIVHRYWAAHPDCSCLSGRARTA